MKIFGFFWVINSTLMMFLGFVIGVAISSKPEPKIEYQYRYFGDKTRPDNWLQKYSVPTRHYVWVDDVGTYVEVTEEEWKTVPTGGTLKTRIVPLTKKTQP